MRYTLRKNILIGAVGLLLLGVFSFTANITDASNDDSIPKEYSDLSQVEYLAVQFADLVTSVDNDKEAITIAYSDAATMINTIERHRGVTGETRQARNTMQKAVDAYMEQHGYDQNDQLSQNLHVYSKFLTETLIARSNGKLVSK